MKRSVVVAVVLALSLVGTTGAATAASSAGTPASAPIDPALQRQLAAAATDQLVDVLVVLKSQTDLRSIPPGTHAQRVQATVKALRAHALLTQKPIVDLLATRKSQGTVTSVRPLWVANDVAVRATPAVINELAARAEVAKIVPNSTIQAPAPAEVTAATPTTVEPNIALVNAPAMWASGYTGQGIVVANLDTGVDVTQPDLAAKWRGGTNSWYDPNGQHPTTPTDLNGHGTQTMGVMVGGDAGGSSVGVAPDAKWIAAKIFNDSGAATTTGIHLAFQWLLDPDGNPATADAPNVVNASWTMSAAGCNTDFQPDLQSLRAAGILPVFAAGNDGPFAGTVFSPANLPEAFAVGGTDNSDALYASSSQGPSACAGATSPSLVAPAVGIRTTDLFGGYATDTGTSVAAPHVAGGLALLLNAHPGLSADQQASALKSGAVDLGLAGVDDSFGYGRLDIAAAYQSITPSPDFTIGASPSSATALPGGTASYDVTITGTNGFTGDVTLSLTGLSGSQASWTFTPSTVSGGSGTSSLALQTDPGLAPGTYPLTVTATSGTLTHQIGATLVVQAAPDFTVTATPATQTTAPGGSRTFTVSVGAVGGFAADTALTVTGLSPAVGTATLTPAVVTGPGGSQLAITTLGTATVGSYPLTITGTSGTLTHAASVTLVVSAPPDFTLAASPTTQTTAPGGSRTYSITVGALNGFAGDTSLSLTGLSTTVGTAMFTPTVVHGPGGSQLVVTTRTTAPAGTYPLTIRGTSGSKTHSTSVTLVITSARNFTVSASPSQVTVYRGGSASYTVSVAPVGGFTGTVSLSVSGVPTGASASLTPTQVVTRGTSTLRLRTYSTTQRGTFVVTVTARNGSLVHQTTVTLVVR